MPTVTVKGQLVVDAMQTPMLGFKSPPKLFMPGCPQPEVKVLFNSLTSIYLRHKQLFNSMGSRPMCETASVPECW